MDRGAHARERLDPVGPELRLHQLLRLLEILHPREAVAVPSVVQRRLFQLLGQPLPSIEKEGNGEGQPALQPGAHEYENRMPPVLVNAQALAGSSLEFALFGFAMAP